MTNNPNPNIDNPVENLKSFIMWYDHNPVTPPIKFGDRVYFELNGNPDPKEGKLFVYIHEGANQQPLIEIGEYKAEDKKSIIGVVRYSVRYYE